MNLIEQTMTSLEMAELSGKRHDNVKSDIEKILSNVEIDFLKFQEVSVNHQNQQVTVYRLPKQETLLVTSKWSDSQRWKIIQKLEAQSQNLTSAEMILMQAQKLVEHERQIAELEHQQKETAGQVAALVNGEDYFTVVGYANVTGQKVNSPTAAQFGKQATAICKEKDWTIGSANHPYYGQVQTYPREALEQVFWGGE